MRKSSSSPDAVRGWFARLIVFRVCRPLSLEALAQGKQGKLGSAAKRVHIPPNNALPENQRRPNNCAVAVAGAIVGRQLIINRRGKVSSLGTCMRQLPLTRRSTYIPYYPYDTSSLHNVEHNAYLVPVSLCLPSIILLALFFC